MNTKTLTKIFNSIYVIMAVLLIIGSYLKLDNNPLGHTLTMIGLVVGVVVLIIENTMLKMIIKRKAENGGNAL
ncbi:MAG: hypothetical protein R6U19_00680 [Bacteroidales bacterium]